jgi:hypothetical protein
MKILKKIWGWVKRLIGVRRIQRLKSRARMIRRRWRRSAIRKVIVKQLPEIKRKIVEVVKDAAIVVTAVVVAKVLNKLAKSGLITPEQLKVLHKAIEQATNAKVWNVLREALNEVAPHAPRLQEQIA